MQPGPIFYVVCGVWALAVVAVLIRAIRLCYVIEARSGRRLLNGLPGYANLIPVAFNLGVARDADTQAMRWRMNGLLLLILFGFAALYAWLALNGARG